MTGGNRQFAAEVGRALEWLERQPAPEIDAARADVLESYRISVPNNDMDIAAAKWRDGAAFDPAVLRTLKTISPRMVMGDGPHLIYRWRDVQPDDRTAEGLRRAVHELHTLGWGVDMAYAELRQETGESIAGNRWKPTTRGLPLQLPVKGTLNDLRETYSKFLDAVTKAGVDADTRPTVYQLQHYSHAERRLDTVEFQLNDLTKDQFRSFPAEHAMVVAAWMRNATSIALRNEGWTEEEVNWIALGHSDGEKNSDRLAYLPVSTVGSGHEDGRIRRVMVTMRGRPDLLELLRRKMNGRILTDIEHGPMCRLVAATRNRVTRLYLERGNEWATVTPLVLHGYNASGGRFNLNKTEKLVGQAFEQAGFSTALIEEWAFQPAPFWKGTSGARSIRVPKHLERWPRYHIWVKFREKVAGPVIAGIGRHYGLGVFAKVSGT